MENGRTRSIIRDTEDTWDQRGTEGKSFENFSKINGGGWPSGGACCDKSTDPGDDTGGGKVGLYQGTRGGAKEDEPSFVSNDPDMTRVRRRTTSGKLGIQKQREKPET